MSTDELEASRRYLVVVNGEGQYSIWPADGQPPNGWRSVGAPRTRSECLSEIETTWIDMRPASLRAYLDGQVQNAE
jgi:MbtH protein